MTSVFSICLVGYDPPHLVKSNVLYNNISGYCHGRRWCREGNQDVVCPLYASLCSKTTNTLCAFDGENIRDVRIESGVPGLKQWQLSGKSY